VTHRPANSCARLCKRVVDVTRYGTGCMSSRPLADSVDLCQAIEEREVL